MDQENPSAPRTHQPRTGDIVPVPQRGKLRPHYAGKARNKHQTDGNHDAVFFPGPDQTDNQQGQEKTRKCRQRVVKPHQHIVHDAAEIAGHRADERAHKRADRNRGKRNRQGRAAALQHPAENIPAEVVRSEEMRHGGRLETAVFHGRRHIGCPENADHGDNQHHPGDDQPDEEVTVDPFLHHAAPPDCSAAMRSLGSMAWLTRSAAVPASTTQNARITTIVWTTG